jgi:2-polyprenyl-3-methyl-5-hydroxy-6-metoxy-1,4-benzoquinol methylase
MTNTSSGITASYAAGFPARRSWHHRAVGVDLSGSAEGVPERFVPDSMRSSIVDAEHRARYWWISRLVQGCRVLDAGCGMGYGSAILAEAGAAEVIAIDNVEPVVEAAQSRVPSTVQVQQGDVAHLTLDADSFDVVVCFEVIEHVQEPEAVLDELARVLRPGGVLAVSSPNRDAYPPGNPHHVHEFQPEELRRALEERFAHVQILRQHDFVTSAILDDEAFGSEDGTKLGEVDIRKIIAQTAGNEAYTLGLASDEPLPQAPFTAVLTRTLELREWLERFDAQQEAFDGQKNQLAELRAIAGERTSLLQRLEEAERRAADQLNLMESLNHAEALLARNENQLDDAKKALDLVTESLSWKLTAPLRGLKRLLSGREA